MNNIKQPLIKFTFPRYMLFCIVSSTMLLSACGEHADVKKAGQSIASVNGEEITIHQVNDMLQATKVDPKLKDQAAKKIVESLIDRTILVQAAIDQKLDRNPQIMSAIENSKQQILAQAYLQNKVSSISEPTDVEILKYHDENPNVFANRKLYAMDQLSFSVDQSLIANLEKLSDEATRLDQVTAWLKSHGVKYSQGKKVLAAENLPKKLLEKMSAMKNDELIFINDEKNIMVARLIETQLQPISIEDAKPLIKLALMNVKKAEAAKAEMARLKQIAKVKYLDESYKLESNPAAEVSKAIDKTPESEVQAPKSKDVEMMEHVEKGLSGL